MKNLRNPVIGFVIFGILVSLCVTIYGGFETKYSTEKQDIKLVEVKGVNQTGDIMDQLNRMYLVQGMNGLGTSIQKITLPASGVTDILGALAGVGIGVLKTITGIVLLPIQIGGIISSYYQIPSIIYTGLGAIMFVIIGFILLSAYLRSDV